MLRFFPGEDRWLCTLMLQQGYRIEYCAASDSYTNAPEGFDEFFNQRRRWMPSTMANVVDLLQSWKHTTSVNENISFLYIFYQGALLVASLLSPGIIFMMMVGALYASMKNWTDKFTIWGSAILNFVPLLVFIILCYKAKPAVQVSRPLTTKASDRTRSNHEYRAIVCPEQSTTQQRFPAPA